MGKFDSIGLSFADVKAGEGSEPIPNGRYHVRVERWEETTTKDDGQFPNSLMYKLAVSVAQEEAHGRWIFEQFTVFSDEALEALEPSKRTKMKDLRRTTLGSLKEFFISCGISEEEINSDDFDPTTEWGDENLVGKELDAEVGFRQGRDGYQDTNKLTKYYTHIVTADDLLV